MRPHSEAVSIRVQLWLKSQVAAPPAQSAHKEGAHKMEKFYKEKLVALMQSNMQLIETSIKLHLENQKLKNKLDILNDKYLLARRERKQVLENLIQNPN